MKTKFRTLAAIATISLFGTFTANAAKNNSETISQNLNIEQEYALTLESWMTDESIWSIKPASEVIDAESPLEIESWMIDSNLWK